MSILPKVIYTFKSIPIKIPMSYFNSIFGEQTLQKYVWNQKRPQIASAILRKQYKVGGMITNYTTKPL